MDDTEINLHIEELVAEEHRLLELAEEERRARRGAARASRSGQDRARPLLGPPAGSAARAATPGSTRTTAKLRSADTVEHYEQ